MRLFIFIGLILLSASCANIIPPTGGPQDSIPPTLIRSIPTNGEINYKGQSITLEFDEAIQLKDAKEEIIITPSVGKETKYLYKKNLVTIEPGDRFQQDLTYSIAFRQSIQDLNEGNPAEDLRLAFSTGPYIDSLMIYGKVTTAAEAKPAEKFTVAIYQSDTFNIFKHAPVYIARTAKNGTFSIRNLKPGRYNVYAFNDKNKNLKVDSQNEWFGSAPSPVNIPADKDSVMIPVLRVDTRPLKMNSSRGISNFTTIRLNKAPAHYRLQSVEGHDRILSHYAGTRSEITAYPPLAAPDSIHVRLSAVDSVGQAIDTTFYIKQTKQKPIKETFKATYRNIGLTTATRMLKAEILVNIPIKTIHSDSIQVVNDSIPLSSIKSTSIKYDTMEQKLTIAEEYTLPDSLQERKIMLNFKKGWAYSIFKDTLTASNQRVSVKSQKNQGTIEVTTTTKREKIRIEAMSERYETIENQILGKTNTFKNLDPQGTVIRAFQDHNNNGKWDFGNPLTNDPPEPVWIYTGKDGKRSIPLRANWVVDIEWIIP